MDEVVLAFQACGDFEGGFARVYCDECHSDYLVAFSCSRRVFCPSCAAKRAAIFGALLREEILEDVGHAQWVFTIPKPLRPYFLHHRELLGKLSQAAWETVLELHAAANADVARARRRAEKAQAQEKTDGAATVLPFTAERRRLRRAWAQMIRRVYEVDPLTCRCGAQMRVVAFILDPRVVTKILRHLASSDTARERAPPTLAALSSSAVGAEHVDALQVEMPCGLQHVAVVRINLLKAMLLGAVQVQRIIWSEEDRARNLEDGSTGLFQQIRSHTKPLPHTVLLIFFEIF